MTQSGPPEVLSMQFDPKRFRTALGAFATGVTVVTTCTGDGDDVGMTASSFNSVSLSPPMILWSLSKTSSNFRHFDAARAFAVHVLSARQDNLASQFSRKGADRFGGLTLDRGEDGIPLLRDCSARFECRTAFKHEGGDHIIILGEVVTFTHSSQAPLVFHGGRYAWAVARDVEDVEHNASLDTSDTPLTPNMLLFDLARAYHYLRADAVTERRARDWSETEYHAVALLGAQGEMPFQKLDQLLALRGYAASPDVVALLERRGLVVAQHTDNAPSSVSLSSQGKQAFVEVMARAQSTETSVLDTFEAWEVQMLKALLHRVALNRTSTLEQA